MSQAFGNWLLAALLVAMITSAAIRVRRAQIPPVAARTRTEGQPASVGARGGREPLAVPNDTIDPVVIVENDIFRLANMPAAVRYAPGSSEQGIGMPLQPRVRPTLILRAIVGGPPWHALVEGLAGPGAVVVRAGEVVGALRIRAITRDSVFIMGSDTAWTLTLPGASR